VVKDMLNYFHKTSSPSDYFYLLGGEVYFYSLEVISSQTPTVILHYWWPDTSGICTLPRFR